MNRDVIPKEGEEGHNGWRGRGRGERRAGQK